MSDGDALLRAVCEQPDDDTARLVYADWLQENGDPLRAEFIRWQCRFPEWDPEHPRFSELVQEEEPFRPHYAHWASALPHAKGVRWWTTFWHRGFLNSVTFNSAKAFTDHAAAVFGAAPVTFLEVRRVTDSTVTRVLESEYAVRLRFLNLCGPYGFAGVSRIASCAGLSNLRALCVWGGCPDKGARALAESPHLGNLTTLSFSGHTLTDRGVLALADSAHLRGVRRLVLHGTHGLSADTVAHLKRRFNEVE